MLPTPYQLAKRAVLALAPWLVDLLPYRLRRRRNFIIISHPRSGSNFLRDALNVHPDTFEFGELFHPNPLVSIYPKRILWKDQLLEEDIVPLMDAVARQRRVVVPGFTLFSRAKGHGAGPSTRASARGSSRFSSLGVSS